MKLLVLWEDDLQRGTQPVDYGPHGLLSASVTDRCATDCATDLDWYRTRDEIRVRQLRSIACGGIDKLVRRLADDDLYAGGMHVLAIYDDDRIRSHLGLAADRLRTTPEAVNDELARRAGPGRRFAARPIGHDLESLIDVLASPDVGGSFDVAELAHIAAKASGGRAHRGRDLVLQRHASHATRQVRARLAEASPAWRAIVDAAHAALFPPPPG